MRQPLMQLATGKPRLVYVLTVLLTVLLGSQIPRIQIDTDPENMLPDDQTDRVFHNQVEETFRLHDALVVGLVNTSHPEGVYNVQSMTALHKLTDEILQLDGVIEPDLMSLAVADNITQGEQGQLRFEWMMKQPPETPEEAEALRAHVEDLPMLRDTLVSGDGKAAAIYVPIESKDLSYALSQRIRELAAEHAPDQETHITGLPVAEDTFGHEMFVQMAISAPLAGLMIFLLMWYFFRSVRLIIAPMIVAVVTVIATMGLLIGLGFTVHIMSSMIPIFLMPIAVVDSVHIMSEFADRYGGRESAEKAIREVVGHLFRPMLFTSLTSSVGFFSLLLTPIPPVRVFGAFVGFGILLAFLVTIVFIPAYVVRMKPDSLKVLARLGTEEQESNTLLARVLRRTGSASFASGKLILAVTAIVVALSVAGVMRIQINDNPVRWFKSSHEIRIADRVLNDHFAGTYDAYLVLDYDNEDNRAETRRQLEELAGRLGSGPALDAVREAVDAEEDESGAWLDRVIGAADDALFEVSADDDLETLEEILSTAEQASSRSNYFQRPDALAMIDDLQQALVDTGKVGKVNALPDVVKTVNRELRSGEPEDYRIPDSQRGVAQTLLQFQSSHRPQDLWHMVTPDYQQTTLWLQLTSGDNQDMERVIEATRDYLDDNPLPEAVSARWAGKTYINRVWQQEMVEGMLYALLSAFVVVFLMMTFLFRSIRFGILAMLPLSATILGVYGLIGWVGKDYDMPIAVLSSLTLGLSIDFAIHFIQRMRSLYGELGSFARAAQAVFEEPARAISRNAIVIALGFTPLFLAPLVPYITVGAFMASIMAISGVATLILLPGVLGVARRLFFPAETRNAEAEGSG
ncbi:efflux RND transporter permease subunit [Lentisalinibacter salinarum]|uniref:efflux RND transporter permease subunit n=1 Tax=Lentisalinibacter salinarum TaxID=2992239 RepID=UPI00386CCA58